MDDDKRDKSDSWEGLVWEPHKYNERCKLKAGTYLRSFCPHCGRELTQQNAIHLEVVGPDGETGWIDLSPYLNVFEHKTDIKLPQGKEVQELRCSHCHRSLVLEDRRCKACRSHVASFTVGISSAKVPFFVCMREGCHWHAVSADDESRIILDSSDEW